MVGIPIAFADVGERALASYDFIDIATGTGYNTYYATNGPSGTTFLTDKAVYADLIIMGNEFPTINTADGQGAKLDYDFDITFNLPQTLRGRCIVEIPHGYRDGGNQTTYQRMHAYIRKVELDGSETNLISMSGSQWLSPNQTAAAETLTSFSTLSGEIPLTHFQKGSKLRLTIQDSTWESGGNTHHIFIGADPQNRLTNDKANISGVVLTFPSGSVTALRCHIPFRIDL